jgi:uncharacterized protein YkwD
MLTTLTLCALVTLGAETAEAAEKTEPDLHPVEQRIIHLTNLERAKYGLPPLKADEDLMNSARQHCGWMARTRRFQHTSRPVAENIAMGQPDSDSALRSWMNSSGHRANILGRGYGKIGVASYKTEGGQVYWVQQFRR